MRLGRRRLIGCHDLCRPSTRFQLCRKDVEDMSDDGTPDEWSAPLPHGSQVVGSSLGSTWLFIFSLPSSEFDRWAVRHAHFLSIGVLTMATNQLFDSMCPYIGWVIPSFFFSLSLNLFGFLLRQLKSFERLWRWPTREDTHTHTHTPQATFWTSAAAGKRHC